MISIQPNRKDSFHLEIKPIPDPANTEKKNFNRIILQKETNDFHMSMISKDSLDT